MHIYTPACVKYGTCLRAKLNILSSLILVYFSQMNRYVSHCPR